MKFEVKSVLFVVVAALSIAVTGTLFGSTSTSAMVREPAPVVNIEKTESELAIKFERKPFEDLAGNAKQIQCLAENIYHEARGEGQKGMIAVGYVTLNRVKRSEFPNTICDVVKEGRYRNGIPKRYQCQFTWWCDGRPDTVRKDSEQWKNSLSIAVDLFNGELNDPTKGATHYFNYNIVSPRWQYALAKTTVIRNHAFYRL
jgi:spore germination cell wall hydrolase CwlJ-like protein